MFFVVFILFFFKQKTAYDMRISDWISDVCSSDLLAPSMRGAVLALGNFDGFHVGHQAVVSHASTLARREGRLLLVATFDPHPVRYFNPAAEPFLLSSLVQRHRLDRKSTRLNSSH